MSARVRKRNDALEYFCRGCSAWHAAGSFRSIGRGRLDSRCKACRTACCRRRVAEIGADQTMASRVREFVAKAASMFRVAPEEILDTTGGRRDRGVRAEARAWLFAILLQTMPPRAIAVHTGFSTTAVTAGIRRWARLSAPVC